MRHVMRKHEASFKAKVALEAIKGEKPISQLSSESGVHPNQIRAWRDRALQAMPGVFSRGVDRKEKDHEALKEELYRQIGQLKVENEWRKKNFRSSAKCETGDDRDRGRDNRETRL